MRKLYNKKGISLIAAFSMLLTTCLPIYAGNSSATITQVSQSYVLSAEDKQDILLNISDIPTFIVATSLDDETAKENASETISANINERNQLKVKNSTDLLSVKTNSYEIAEQNVAGKAQLLTFFPKSFAYIDKMISTGDVPAYIIVHMKNNPFDNDASTYLLQNANSGSLDDIDFWENSFDTLGTYDGYKFLYGEVQTHADSGLVEAEDISASFNWRDLATSCVQTWIMGRVGDSVEWFSTAVEAISDIFGSIEPPFSITYGNSDGHFKARVDGDLYTREVYIRDDDDRLSGYAYYSCAITQWFDFQHYIETRYPVGRLSTGTLDYTLEYSWTEDQSINTPGCFGGRDFYETLIDYYNNHTGFYSHEEYLDVRDAMVEIMFE